MAGPGPSGVPRIGVLPSWWGWSDTQMRTLTLKSFGALATCSPSAAFDVVLALAFQLIVAWRAKAVVQRAMGGVLG